MEKSKTSCQKITNNFGFLEAVPLILEQTLWLRIFGTSTVLTPIYEKVINHTRLTSSEHVFEPPLVDFLQIVLFHTSTALGLCRDYLFINGMIMLRLDFDVIVSDQFKLWSNFE